MTKIVESHTFEVTITLKKSSLEYIKGLPGLHSISVEFAKSLIENSLGESQAELNLDHGAELTFEISTIHHMRPR